jgi:hypothetical protein
MRTYRNMMIYRPLTTIGLILAAVTMVAIVVLPQLPCATGVFC